MDGTATSPWPAADQLWSAGDRALDMARAVLGARDAPVGLSPKEVVWRKNKARLYHYTRSTPAAHRTPVLLILPLINRAFILDLRPGASFVQALLQRGFEVFMLDWGIPGEEDQHLDLDVLITRYMTRAARKTSEAVGGGPVTVLGYCIGGALATCYTALYQHEPVEVKNLVLFTTPIDFSDAGFFGNWTARDAFPVDKLADVFPTVPGQLPDFGSKMLNPLPSTVGTYVRLWGRLGDPTFDVEGWQAMYRWVNEGVPFPSAAYRQWIKDFYQGNRLVKGTLVMDGRPVRLETISCPLLNVAALNDPIAPRSTTSAIVRLAGSRDKSELVLKGGHVGVVVGRAASTELWPHVADWLAEHD